MNDDGKGQDFGTNWGNHINGITVTRYANELITWEKLKDEYRYRVGIIQQTGNPGRCIL